MIPAELSIRELAALLDIPRHVLEYRIKCKRIPVERPSGNPRGKMVVTIETVRLMWPHAYEALVHVEQNSANVGTLMDSARSK